MCILVARGRIRIFCVISISFLGHDIVNRDTVWVVIFCYHDITPLPPFDMNFPYSICSNMFWYKYRTIAMSLNWNQLCADNIANEIWFNIEDSCTGTDKVTYVWVLVCCTPFGGALMLEPSVSLLFYCRNLGLLFGLDELFGIILVSGLVRSMVCSIFFWILYDHIPGLTNYT